MVPEEEDGDVYHPSTPQDVGPEREFPALLVVWALPGRTTNWLFGRTRRIEQKNNLKREVFFRA